MLLLRDQWERSGIWNGWRWYLVERTAKALNMTVWELGMMAAVSISDMKRYRVKGVVPPSVALHFRQLKDFTMRNKKRSRGRPVHENIRSVAAAEIVSRSARI